MKFSVRLLAISFLVVPAFSSSTRAVAQSPSAKPVLGTWQGVANVHGTDVPITLRISEDGSRLNAAFLNGPAANPDVAPASSVSLSGNHLVATFDYFARTLDATITGDRLSGTYGAIRQGVKTPAPTPFTAGRVTKLVDPPAATNAPNLTGSWEIATTSTKGENAWELRVDPPAPNTAVVKAAIQRIDGDTGGLWGTWNGTRYTLGHFTAAGGALYSLTPQADGTLLVRSLLGGVHGASPDLVARRPDEARKLNLPAPTESTQQTSVKDPKLPFAFSFPDLGGKLVSNTDPQFRGKVVIVAIGGSWCPNCHDEAPLLVSLYKRFHSKGLEIVNLDFEQGDPETDTARLKAFIQHYGITYPVLVAGTTDQLNEKIPQGVNLNCWPTSFFIGRDGLVKETHAGFAGPGNTGGHAALEREVTDLIERLLAQPAPTQSAALTN